MAIAILFSLTVMSAGFVSLRTLGLAKGALGVGLAPGAGLAVLSIVSTWLVLLGVPPPVPGVVLALIALAGVGLAVHDRTSIAEVARSVSREQRLALLVFMAACLAPVLILGVAFAAVQVPLSPHDGATHTQAVQAHRSGLAWADWYPPGVTSLFGAWLQLVPWLDSAKGAFELGVSLPLLAVAAVFGLGVATWRDVRMAATSGLLLSFTYLFPYFPQMWSGWPLSSSLVLVVTLWAASLEYLTRPSWRWGALAGLVLGSIVLVHGTELYTLALVLPIILIAGWRNVQWRRLPLHLGLAAGLAVLCAAIYMPFLFNWAGAGGAYSSGLVDLQTTSVGASTGAAPDPFVAFALGSLGIDLPIRLCLLAIGIAWCVRHRTSRHVLAVGILFATLSAMFTLFNPIPIVRQVYAATFPWGMHYRMFMVVALAQVLLAGAGAVSLLRWCGRMTDGPGAGRRRFRRALRVVVATSVGLMVWATTLFIAYPTDLVLGYSSDDAAAMGWLRAHTVTSDLVINDGAADAGIWTPYKAGTRILRSQWGMTTAELEESTLVIENVAHLDRSPDAMVIACAVNATYVYRGARASAWAMRSFPSLSELRAAPALEEVFSSGEAVVFKTRLTCAPST